MKAGDQVVVIENVEGNAWPRVKVYRLINAALSRWLRFFSISRGQIVRSQCHLSRKSRIGFRPAHGS